MGALDYFEYPDFLRLCEKPHEYLFLHTSTFSQIIIEETNESSEKKWESLGVGSRAGI